MRVASSLVLALVLIGCPPPTGGSGGGGGGGSTGGTQSGQLSNRCANARFEASAAAGRISAFLGATGEFTRATVELEGSLYDICKGIGGELGMSQEQLSGDLRTTCMAVRDTIRSEMAAVGEGIEITIVATPPRCEVSIDAYASCVAECDVNVEPGSLQVTCEGGEIIGQCSAECQGSCAVEIQGECSGRCDGTCNAGCNGSCFGTCEGNCAAVNADGQCEGRCDGTCHGTCSAGCQGSCEGTCWVEGQASCQGECRGGCSVEYEAPRCETDYTPPEVDADCHASCDARLQARAECQPGELEVQVTGDTSGAGDRIDRLRAAFGHFRQLAVVRERARRVAGAGQELVASVRRLRGTAQAGVEALACVAEAALVIPSAAASVSVSVEVSVSVSASASAE